MSAVAIPKKNKLNADELQWQAEDDMRTLARAEEVKRAHTADPARKKRCQDCAKKQMDEMKAAMGAMK